MTVSIERILSRGSSTAVLHPLCAFAKCICLLSRCGLMKLAYFDHGSLWLSSFFPDKVIPHKLIFMSALILHIAQQLISTLLRFSLFSISLMQWWIYSRPSVGRDSVCSWSSSSRTYRKAMVRLDMPWAIQSSIDPSTAGVAPQVSATLFMHLS